MTKPTLTELLRQYEQPVHDWSDDDATAAREADAIKAAGGFRPRRPSKRNAKQYRKAFWTPEAFRSLGYGNRGQGFAGGAENGGTALAKAVVARDPAMIRAAKIRPAVKLSR